MPTAVAELAVVPCSPTCSVSACWTRPMQQACGDSAWKSADEVNATPMPSPASRDFMLTLTERFTRGSAMPRDSTPFEPDARAVVMAPRIAVVGIAHAVAPAGGSSATMASLPPRYGSRAAVHPARLTVWYGPPCMNWAVTCRPAAVVNDPGLVWAASNGVAHAA